ncbi:glutamate receptor-like [Panulirus ornatus]|uniref:glutamate receptor-like n=1 Tax=Panulirus ornatus TaxID=150431 RepID=UPI003A85646F
MSSPESGSELLCPPSIWLNDFVLKQMLTSPSAPEPSSEAPGQGVGSVNRETLAVAGDAAVSVLSTVLHPHCSLMLLTDGNTSPGTIRESVLLRHPWGSSVLEVTVNGQDAQVLEKQFFRVVSDALRVRQLSWCMTVVVVSDDPAFLAAFMESSLKNLLLVWSTKLLVVTRLSLPQLQHLHTSFSMTNTVLLVVDDNHGLLECRAYVHLPYSPPDAQPLQAASWTPERGLAPTAHHKLFPDKFNTLFHRPNLAVAAEEFLPHAGLVKEDDIVSPSQIFEGPMVHLLEIMANTMNFTYKYVRPPDGSWGNKMKNGSWTGMVGMVGRKEVDFGLGPFSARSPREEMVDFTRPVMLDDHRVIARRGRPEVDPWGFLLPLKPLVWVAILTTLLIVLAIVLLLSSYSGLTSNANTDKASNMVYDYIRVLLQQDYSASLELWWERFLLASWMMMTLVLTRSYAGTLMSLLAVRHIPQPYQSIQDVLDDPSIIMIWESKSALVQYFRTAKTGVFREVGDSEKEGRIRFARGYEYYWSMDTLVRQGDHVIMAETLYGIVLQGQDFSNTGKCDFYMSGDVFLPFMMTMVGPKGSPLVPPMNWRIKWVTQTGLYYQWMEAVMPNVSYCKTAPSKIAVSTSLALSNVWGMFAVLLGGHTVSLLVLGLELLSVALRQVENVSILTS